ncbi:MAG: tetratricopeptide repeat protein [Pyrinomonadaceae bacterium]
MKTFRAFVLYYLGEAEQGAALLREVLARQPKLDGIRPILAMCLSAQGQHSEARRELNERVRETAEADHDVAYWLAAAYAVEGEREEALRWLARAIELGNENRIWFESDPNWATLRSDPDFQSLMRKIEAGKAAN